MAIADFRQWSQHLPLSFQDRLSEVRERLKHFELFKFLSQIAITKTARETKARNIAKEVADSGRNYYEFTQHIGYVTLVIHTKYQHCLTFKHDVHWRGAFCDIPKFEQTGFVAFRYRQTPLEYGSKYNPTSYLDIIEVS